MFVLQRAVAVGLLAGAFVWAGQAAAAFDARTPRDVRAPRLLAATVAGKRLTLSFDERMRARALNPTSIKVSLNGRRIAVRSATAAGRQVVLVLSEQAFGDDVVSVSFMRDSGGEVPRDLAGNEARIFVRPAIVNRSLPGCTPTLDPGPLLSALSVRPFSPPGLYAPAIGAVRAIALFVDFPDTPATETTAAVGAHVLDAAPHWYAAASYGRMQLTIDRLDRWVRMPRASNEYGISRQALGLPGGLIADAVAAADAEIDFRPYKLVYVLAARNSAVTYSPAYVMSSGSGVRADGTELTHGAIFGNDTRGSFGSSTAIHETGHALGLPDLYDFATVGRSDKFVGNWDVMSDLNAGAGFLAWSRWKLRWLDRGQLRCYRGATREVELTPLDSPGGVKAIVIPLDASRAWVLEARRKQSIDSTLCSEGVLAYLVDATILSGSGPVKIRSAGPGSDRSLIGRCGTLYDAPLTMSDGRRGFAEGTFAVELLEQTSSGAYRVRVGPRT